MIRLIAAIDRKNGMAKHGFLPWSIPKDEKFFTDQTKLHDGNVLTGATTFRHTYNNQPLSDRHNYILTHDTSPIEGVTVVNDLNKLLNDFANGDLWVAGGAHVFKQVIEANKADELYITHIEADFGCDQFFPDFKNGFKLAEKDNLQEQNGFIFRFAKYVRRNNA